MPHAVVKEAEIFRVPQLVKKIETHPHRAAFRADLQQNNVYNPFSNNSKAMIRELGNVELFELCETTPKVLCSHCLLYSNQGIVYCTCGQCLIYSESRRTFNRLRLHALSIPNYVIKKGPAHGARHVVRSTKSVPSGLECVEDAVSKSTPKVIMSQVFTIDFSEIQFIVNHNSQSDGQNQQFKEWDELAKVGHTYHLTPEEKKRYQGQWCPLNRAGKNGPMKLRSAFRAAVLMKNRLHHESGEPIEEHLHENQQRRWNSSSSTSW